MAGEHSAANSQNVPAGDSVSSSHGTVCPTSAVPPHNAKVAMDMARPRTRVGYISESNTQMTGPNDAAKQAM